MFRKSVSAVFAASLLCLVSATMGSPAPSAASSPGSATVLSIPPRCC